MMPPEHNMAEYEHGCGQRLRAAREKAGLSLVDVGARLRIPVRVIEALEAEEWERIGAPVFVRGQLRSYSRLLGLPTEPVQAASGIAPIQPTRLVPRTRTPPMQRIADQIGGRLVYIVITALIILPVWVATRSHLDTQQDAAPLELQPAATEVGTVQSAAMPPAREPSAVVASMASLPPRPEPPMLEIRLDGESWLQVMARDGQSVVEEALLGAGDTRSYPVAEVGNVVIGNVEAAEVRSNDQVRDLAPFERANVARFTVSSDGSLAPVSD